MVLCLWLECYGRRVVDYITAKVHKMLKILHRTCKDISDVETKTLLYVTRVRFHLVDSRTVEKTFLCEKSHLGPLRQY